MSDEPLPPPPDVLAYGEFTLSLRSVLNGKWVVRIAHQARCDHQPLGEGPRDRLREPGTPPAGKPESIDGVILP
jgi:hypothetical protein